MVAVSLARTLSRYDCSTSHPVGLAGQTGAETRTPRCSLCLWNTSLRMNAPRDQCAKCGSPASSPGVSISRIQSLSGRIIMKLSPCLFKHCTVKLCANSGVAPRILNLGIRCRQVARFTLRQPQSRLMTDTRNKQIGQHEDGCLLGVAPCSLVKFTDVSDVLAAAIIRAIASTSETSVNLYKTTRRNIPEDSHLHTRRC
jgi:hypothetical protein